MALIPPRTLKGFRDLLPAQALRRARIVRTVEDCFRRHGYAPIDTPVLEYAEILKGKGGGDTDKELFEFTDKGGRAVALRFDLTVPLARFVAEHQGELAFPFRRYHVGLAFRGERPQRGRAREFLQCDADLIGATGPAADAEILTLYARIFASLSVEGFVVRCNDRRILQGLLDRLGLLPRAVPVLRALDKWDKVGREGVAAELTALGLAPDHVEGVLAFPACAGADDEETFSRVAAVVAGSPRGVEGLDALRETLRLVRAAGVTASQLRVDPTIARGLDYYTGIVFEAALPSAEGFGSMGGGGRYDDLASLYTATRLPGVGCSVGLTRLLVALAEQGRLLDAAAARTVMVTHPEPGRGVDPAAAFALAAALRHEGFLVETYPEPRKHGAQLKFADRKGLRFVLTLDASGSVHGKDLRSGEAFDVRDPAEAVDELRRRLT